MPAYYYINFLFFEFTKEFFFNCQLVIIGHFFSKDQEIDSTFTNQHDIHPVAIFGKEHSWPYCHHGQV